MSRESKQLQCQIDDLCAFMNKYKMREMYTYYYDLFNSNPSPSEDLLNTIIMPKNITWHLSEDSGELVYLVLSRKN